MTMPESTGEYPTQEERKRAEEVVARLNGEVRFDDERMTDEEAVIVMMCAFGVKRSVAADQLSILRGHGGDIIIYGKKSRNVRSETTSDKVDDGPTCEGLGVPGSIPTLKKED
jgi:hypothetical protein